MKRFYKTVTVTPERGILLDARAVKTPAKAILILPTRALAEAVAQEWRAQDKDILPHSMPFTGFANAAIDRVSPDPAAFAAGLARYGETELMCYRADSPPDLVARQGVLWNALLGWASARYDIGFTLVTGIMHKHQPAEALARLSAIIAARNPWELAALSPIVTIAGSLVIALAVLEREIEADPAFDTAHLDELWQAEKWGEDWMAAETRAAHRKEFSDACRCLRLLND